MIKKEGSFIVGYSSGFDGDLFTVVVGDKDGNIINAFTGEEAKELINKLETVKKK